MSFQVSHRCLIDSPLLQMDFYGEKCGDGSPAGLVSYFFLFIPLEKHHHPSLFFFLIRTGSRWKWNATMYCLEITSLLKVIFFVSGLSKRFRSLSVNGLPNYAGHITQGVWDRWVRRFGGFSLSSECLIEHGTCSQGQNEMI